MGRGALIERGADRAWLESALVTAVAGRGSLVLVSGESRIGKTRFVEDVFGMRGVPFLRGAAAPGGPAYGPVVVALQEGRYERAAPGAAAGLRNSWRALPYFSWPAPPTETALP